MPQIQWSKRAIKQITKIDQRYAKNIKDKIDKLDTFPQVEGLNIKSLTGFDNLYRIRVGDYRVIFKWVKDEEPQIIKIEQIKKRTTQTYRLN